MSPPARADAFTPQSPWLDLVNSQQWDGFGRLTDHLRDAVWVKRFLHYWNVRPQQLGRGAPGVELSGLRAVLRRSAETLVSGQPLPRRALADLNDFLEAPGYRRLVKSGKRLRAEWMPVRRDWRWIAAEVAASFVETFLHRADRIKVCANPLCRWAFVDATKGNVRRWCKDRRCGNRDRVRRARARERRRRR